jgi:hypothetical protein
MPLLPGSMAALMTGSPEHPPAAALIEIQHLLLARRRADFGESLSALPIDQTGSHVEA